MYWRFVWQAVPPRRESSGCRCRPRRQRRTCSKGGEVYPDAQSIYSPTRTIRETVELGQEDTEPEPVSCPVCGGEMVTQQKIELGEWCTLCTEACPQERMGCLRAIPGAKRPLL